jgi:hypothetical protein
MKLCFGDSEPKSIAYLDSNLFGDVDGIKFTLGYCVTHSEGAVT